jgi:hypothetical protein
MEDWSQQEIDIIVADYFSILSDELENKPINKTEHRKKIQPLLRNRSEKSIDFKHMNISAVLRNMGIPYIKGYKPYINYQKLLETNVITYLKNHLYLESTFKSFAESTTIAEPAQLSFEKILEGLPERQPIVKETESIYRTPIKVNYLELEQANSSIGKSGEKIVYDYERWRLIHEGKESLADSIEWVSQTQGDGLGFDILSKNTNGTDRYIEVKSTKLTKEAPIFFSRNEYEFSLSNASNYYLYRVFNLNQNPKIFIANGKFDDFCNYEAVKFRGSF